MNKIALRNISYGVYIISTMDGERPTGCTANSIMQITSDPATIALSMNHDNYTNSCIKKTGKFVINILSEKSNPSLIGGFGFRSGKDYDKFNDVDYKTVDGLPVLSDSCGYIICNVIDTMETSSHTVFLGEMTNADNLTLKSPMTYSYYHNVIKGKSPKNAPTYMKEENVTAPEEKKAAPWVCSVCGYVYDGDTPFKELPDSYICPVCSAPKNKFIQKEH